MDERAIFDPEVWILVLLIAAVSMVGALAKYQFGKSGVEAILAKYPQIGEERLERVHRLFDQHGTYILLLSALPIVATALTTGAGAFGVPRRPFVIYVGLAKIIRYWVLILFFGAGYRILT